ncbi:MAG: glycosyltransferase family 4 protein [Campylobacterota bacterium]|nr:glycosyltransferase family 4 protein [Campylobacterota bacterium]
MNKKNIWIINHYALTPEMSGGTRHYDFALELVKRAYKVTIIASSFHYAKFKEMKEYPSGKNYLVENIDGIDFIWLKTPPYSGNSIGRVKNMISFMFSVANTIPKLNLKKPDTIIGSSVHLFAVYAAYSLSKTYNAKFIMEVRDLWPKTLIDMGISKWHPFILLLGWLEKFLYKKADKIISTLPFAYRYIEQFVKKDKIVWISNGTDCSKFDDNYEQMLSRDKFNVVYTGTHGTANDLDLLIESVKVLKNNEHIHFTLVGDGPLKESLIAKAKEDDLKNITFIPSVAKNRVKNYLKSADLLYVGLKNLPLYRYGMSMNKIFDYMASKRAILFVSNIEDNIIETSNSGIVIKSYQIQDIVKAIIELSKEDTNYLEQFGANGHTYLKQNFDIKVLVDKLEKIL